MWSSHIFISTCLVPVHQHCRNPPSQPGGADALTVLARPNTVHQTMGITQRGSQAQGAANKRPAISCLMRDVQKVLKEMAADEENLVGVFRAGLVVYGRIADS